MTICEFFGETLAGKLAEDNKKADLLLGNNVLAHVPDIKDEMVIAVTSKIVALAEGRTEEFTGEERKVEFLMEWQIPL